MACWEYRLKTAAKLIGLGILESGRFPSGQRLKAVEADFAGIAWPQLASRHIRAVAADRISGRARCRERPPPETPRRPAGPAHVAGTAHGRRRPRMYIAAAGWPLAVSGTSRISPGSSAGHC